MLNKPNNVGYYFETENYSPERLVRIFMKTVDVISEISLLSLISIVWSAKRVIVATTLGFVSVAAGVQALLPPPEAILETEIRPITFEQDP